MALDKVDFAQWELKADSTTVVPFQAQISKQIHLKFRLMPSFWPEKI
jgi:hypothetical protein